METKEHYLMALDVKLSRPDKGAPPEIPCPSSKLSQHAGMRHRMCFHYRHF